MDSALAQWEEKESSTPDEQWEALQQDVYNTDISWQAREKTPGLVLPQRPGATDSNEQKKPSPPESVAKKPGALDLPLQHTNMPADCYKNKNAPVH